MTKVVEMKDPAGAMAKGYIGFCGPVVLFGALVPLFRGHLIAFVAMLAAYLCVAFAVGAAIAESTELNQSTFLPQLVALGMNVVFAFTYNSWHRSWLLKRGYVPTSEAVEITDTRPAYVRDIEARKTAEVNSQA